MSPFASGIVAALEHFGICVDRVNLPATKHFGFHHPIYASAVLTWTRSQAAEILYQRHIDEAEAEQIRRTLLARSPYGDIVLNGASSVIVDLRATTHGFPLLDELATQGYIEYAALGLPLPNGKTQPISFAAKTPFIDRLNSVLPQLQSILACTVDGLYQGSVANQLAQSYIGRMSGRRVLAGDFVRGNTLSLKAGLLFCDLRNFTAMSERHGSLEVVRIINQTFEAVGANIDKQGGEILKFIGDAMLAVFPVDNATPPAELVDRMIDTVQGSLNELPELSTSLGVDISVGFGVHLGEVQYGNIGTPDRLDFTVMGPAVNLTSRLESMSKTLKVSAVFSEAVGTLSKRLEYHSKVAIKGIERPVNCWVLPTQ